MQNLINVKRMNYLIIGYSNLIRLKLKSTFLFSFHGLTSAIHTQEFSFVQNKKLCNFIYLLRAGIFLQMPSFYTKLLPTTDENCGKKLIKIFSMKNK